MKYLSLGRGAAVLALATIAMPARAQAPLVTRSLETAPADVILRHSGRQAAESWGEYFGYETATGDFNADGRTDLAVSATNDSAPGDVSARRGRVYVFYGRAGGFPALVDPADQAADVILQGTEPFSWFGSELAAGDFDGDGADDLAISENDLSNVHVGRVYVVKGSRIRAASTITMSAGEFDSIIRGRRVGADQGYELFFGSSLAVGDFNRDGLVDLVMGAFAGDGVLGSVRNSGEVAVMLGRRAGWAREMTSDTHSVDMTVGGRFVNHLFGNEVAAGDVDGDGLDELVVSAWGGRGPNGDRSSAGDVAVFSFATGSPVTFPASTDGLAPLGIVWAQGPLGIIHGPTVNSRIGASGSVDGGRGVVIADFDGDGVNDVIIGAPFYGPAAPNGWNTGGVFVVYGGKSLTSGAVVDLANGGSGLGAVAALIGTGDAGSSLGDALAATDLNSDGRADVVAGAPTFGNTGNPREGFGTGSVSVFGGRSRTRTTASPLFTEPDAIVRGYTLPWRAGDELNVVDASFAGRAYVAIGLPESGKSLSGGGRKEAGEISLLDAATLGASLPRQPFVSGLPATAAVRPGSSADFPVTTGGGSGAIASVEVVDSPAFARIEGPAGQERLVLSPAATDRGVFDVTVVATDTTGATGSRKVRVSVGFTPAITSARSKAAGSGVKITISGGGFSKGDAVVEIDGAAVGGVKYPAKFAADGGQTVTRLVVKLSSVRNGASVVVRNPREGLVSNAVVIE